MTGDLAGVILTAMERVRRWWLMSLAFLVLPGCVSAMAVSTAAGSSRTAAGTAAQRCARLARLLPGVSFAAWHLGAVRFSSSSTGVGLTTSAIGCDHRLPTGGIEVPRFYALLVGALRDGDPPPVDPYDAVATLRVLEAARRSAASREVVTLSA